MSSDNWRRLTTSEKLSTTPTFVSNLICTSDGVGAADITLYDGESVNDPQLITIKVWLGMTRQIVFNPPLKTNRGLFYSQGSNVEETLIAYVPCSEKPYGL